MNKVKTIKFWTTVLKEIKDKEEHFFFLCEQSPTFKNQFRQEDRKYVRDLAKKFINQNYQWQYKFAVNERSGILFDIITNLPSDFGLAEGSDRKAIRVEFVNWVINYLRTERKKRAK